jgi:cytidine deaminase
MPKEEQYQFTYEVYDSSSALENADKELLAAAGKAASLSYAPYSKFNVGAAAKMRNGEIVVGANQENASFPAGLCAEGVVMAVAASKFPGVPIETLAISYRSENHISDHPISPCGICRQALQEFKAKTGGAIRLIMGGESGNVFVVKDAASLMPLAFKF